MTTHPGGGRRVGPKLTVEHTTVAERSAEGRATRTDMPRSAHAEFVASPDPPAPIALLECQVVTRVPDLVPIRCGRMMVPPLTFLPGSGGGDGQ